MKIEKKEDEFGTVITMYDSFNKYMEIFFAGNLDLYWRIYDGTNNIDLDGYNVLDFQITKENYALYQLFKDLFKDIITKNIHGDEAFKCEEDILDDEKDEKYLEYFYESMSNYSELISKDKKTITWYSDETSSSVSNYLTIYDNEESFDIKFHTQQYIVGFDKDSRTSHSIPIRFRNSGSKYNPFNIIFMRMYQNLKLIEDVHEKGHQIHMEEYMYEISRKRKKKGMR